MVRTLISRSDRYLTVERSYGVKEMALNDVIGAGDINMEPYYLTMGKLNIPYQERI